MEQERCLYLEESLKREVNCTYCNAVRKIGGKNWLFSDDNGFVCPECVERKGFKKMTVEDLYFKPISYTDPSDPKALGGEVEKVIALDLRGEVIAKEYTKAKCVASVKKYLKYGIIVKE